MEKRVFELFTQYLVVISGRIPIQFIAILPEGGCILIPFPRQVNSLLESRCYDMKR